MPVAAVTARNAPFRALIGAPSPWRRTARREFDRPPVPRPHVSRLDSLKAPYRSFARERHVRQAAADRFRVRCAVNFVSAWDGTSDRRQPAHPRPRHPAFGLMSRSAFGSWTSALAARTLFHSNERSFSPPLPCRADLDGHGVAVSLRDPRRADESLPRLAERVRALACVLLLALCSGAATARRERRRGGVTFAA